MLRSNGNRGEIRTGNFLFVPDCTVDAAKTRSSTGNVSAMSFGHSRLVVPSRQVKSSFKNLHRGCRFGATAVLDAIFALAPSNDTPPSPNGANPFGRGWINDRRLVKGQTKAGIGWAKMRLSLGAAGTTRRAPVRAALAGPPLRRTRPTASGRVSSVTTCNLIKGAKAPVKET